MRLLEEPLSQSQAWQRGSRQAGDQMSLKAALWKRTGPVHMLVSRSSTPGWQEMPQYLQNRIYVMCSPMSKTNVSIDERYKLRESDSKKGTLPENHLYYSYVIFKRQPSPISENEPTSRWLDGGQKPAW